MLPHADLIVWGTLVLLVFWLMLSRLTGQVSRLADAMWYAIRKSESPDDTALLEELWKAAESAARQYPSTREILKPALDKVRNR